MARGTAAHWGHSKCASWPFAHYILRARNGNLRNGNERMELEMVLAMS